MTAFVNPYTFVPHTPAPGRMKPVGHERMPPDRYSGVLKVRLTVRTPLVIGGFKDEETGLQLVPHRTAGDHMKMIPGSGLLGAVRSVHEALAGGCLRVLDTGWVPVHRHPPTTGETEGLVMAVVSDVDVNGMARQVKVCDDWMRVPLAALASMPDRLPVTGDTLRHVSAERKEVPCPSDAVVGDGLRRTLRVKENDKPAGVEPGSVVSGSGMRPVDDDRWVLLVTDTNARKETLPVHFFAGRVGRGSDAYEVPADTWQRYLDTVDGADDLRPATLPDAGNGPRKVPAYDPHNPEYADVMWPKESTTTVAKRLRARKYLHLGQPVWVRIDVSTGQVTEIRLSLLWRYRGDGTVGERAGEAAPCQDPESLCWSCRVFGSADTSGRGKDDLARQDGYRGHVRFDDLLAEQDFEPVTWHLAPLSSPRPSAGQFYLDSSKSAKKLSDKDTMPAANWGSDADKQLRPLRGRKFYWRTANTDPAAEAHPRGRFRDGHQSTRQGKEVQLIPAGTVFNGRIRFDNLSAADYGSLLAALDPRRLAEIDEPDDGYGWDGTVTSVGGGKPFGSGSVNIDIEPELVQTARMRYLGEEGSVPGPEDAVTAFWQQAPGNTTALRHALSFGYVPDDLVWYPAIQGEKGSKEFDESFEFFARTNGIQMKDEDRPLAELPDPAKGPEDQVIRWPVRGNRTNVASRRRDRG